MICVFVVMRISIRMVVIRSMRVASIIVVRVSGMRRSWHRVRRIVRHRIRSAIIMLCGHCECS